MKKQSGRTNPFALDSGKPLSLPTLMVRADHRPAEPMLSDHREMVERGLEAVRTGNIAPEEDVRAIFARYRQ